MIEEARGKTLFPIIFSEKISYFPFSLEKFLRMALSTRHAS
jgi:hypothetical protein